MTTLGNIIIQGGHIQRAAEDYQETRDSRDFAAQVRASGVKKLASDDRRRAAEDSLLDKDTERKRLQQEIDAVEQEFRRSQQPGDQAIRRSDQEHRARMQPGQQAVDQAQQGIVKSEQELTAAQQATRKRLQPGQDVIAGETQNAQTQELRAKQAANLWGLLKTGDKKGTLDLLNSSQILHPGRKFSDIERGQVPAMGADGKPLMQNGQPVMEDMVRLKAADGGEDVFVPVKQLETNYVQQKSSVQKAGNNLVRMNPDGSATPVYEQDQYMAVPESGSVVSKRTGLPPAGAGTRAPGGPAPKAVKALDERVKMAGTHIDKYFGINEFTRLDEKVQGQYNAVKARAEKLVRDGADPLAAGNQALLEGKDNRLGPDGSLKGPAGATPPGAAAPGQPAALPKLW